MTVDSRRFPEHSAILVKLGGDAQRFKELTNAAVALQTVGKEPLQPHLTFGCEGEHLIPIAGGAPVVLYCVFAAPILAWVDNDGALVGLLNADAEVAHQTGGYVDVGATDHFADDAEREPLLHSWGHHQQGGDILRAYIAGQTDSAALQLPPLDVQRWIAIFAVIADIGSHAAQCIH